MTKFKNHVCGTILNLVALAKKINHFAMVARKYRKFIISDIIPNTMAYTIHQILMIAIPGFFQTPYLLCA